MKQPALYATALLAAVGLAGCGSAGSQGAAGASPSGSPASESASSAPVAAAATTMPAVKVGDVVGFAAVTKAVSAASKAKGTVDVTSSLAGMGAVQMDLDLRGPRRPGSP